MVEVCIGIVSVSLVTMRPIYNIIVRGHHCTSNDVNCRVCLRSRMSGGRGRWRAASKWPGSVTSPSCTDDEVSKSVPSDVESAIKQEPTVEILKIALAAAYADGYA